MQILNVLLSYKVLKVLRELSLKPKTKEELRESVSTSVSSLLQILDKMIELGLIEREDDTFRITPKGKFILLIQETVRKYEKLNF